MYMHRNLYLYKFFSPLITHVTFLYIKNVIGIYLFRNKHNYYK